MNDPRVITKSTAQLSLIVLTFLATVFSFLSPSAGYAPREEQKAKTELVSRSKSSKRAIVFSYTLASEFQTFAFFDFSTQSLHYSRKTSTLLKIPPPVCVNKQLMAAALISALSKDDSLHS